MSDALQTTFDFVLMTNTVEQMFECPINFEAISKFQCRYQPEWGECDKARGQLTAVEIDTPGPEFGRDVILQK